MLSHNFTIAFRNIWKYKSQTLISVIGWAVGFTCFALATLWIRYEMSFDGFHKNARQMYVVYEPNVFVNSGYSRNVGYRMSSYLKETFPEIADAIPLSNSFPYNKLTVEGVDIPVKVITSDSSFLRMFDVKILEGSRDFLIPGSNKLAITHEKARQLYGNENPIGKTVNTLTSQFTPTSTELTICAVVKEKSKRSNYTFDFIKSFDERTTSSPSFFGGAIHVIIELFPGANIKAFEKKLYEHNIIVNEKSSINKLIIKAITKIHYTDMDIEREVKFQHILIFSVSGILVILCSLFNYLTLFISRFRIRQKELALRMVCGASGRSLLAMLSVEFILTLLFAVILGCMMTQLVQKPFLTLSEIQMSLPDIYRESLMYIGGVILVSFIVFWLILFIFRKRNLNISIRRSNRNLSRKVSVIAQLVISIVFAFCTIVILKQMYFLHHTDELGFSFKNRGSVAVMEPRGHESVLADYLKQIPEITEIVDAGDTKDLLNPGVTVVYPYAAKSWDDKPVDADPVGFEQMRVTPEYIGFYNLRLAAGELLDDIDPDSLVLINESAVKAFGWHEPVGKHFDRYTVKGVIKNVYNLAPTVETKPIIYIKGRNRPMGIDLGGRYFSVRHILFKYHEGTWKSCKEKIEQIIQKEEYADMQKDISIYEEAYNEFLKSENALIKLLSVVSAICILICVFGFVSLVSLTCEERRKSIAIRKINGATSGDILDMFAKEYFLLLMIGAIIAFATGYFVMQRWLENYVKQTNIPAWIYLAIIFALALVIVLCIGWQVYKASVENPAEVVKKE